MNSSGGPNDTNLDNEYHFKRSAKSSYLIQIRCRYVYEKLLQEIRIYYLISIFHEPVALRLIEMIMQFV